MKPLFISDFHLNIIANYVELETNYCHMQDTELILGRTQGKSDTRIHNLIMDIRVADKVNC